MWNLWVDFLFTKIRQRMQTTIRYDLLPNTIPLAWATCIFIAFPPFPYFDCSEFLGLTWRMSPKLLNSASRLCWRSTLMSMFVPLVMTGTPTTKMDLMFGWILKKCHLMIIFAMQKFAKTKCYRFWWSSQYRQCLHWLNELEFEQAFVAAMWRKSREYKYAN